MHNQGSPILLETTEKKTFKSKITETEHKTNGYLIFHFPSSYLDLMLYGRATDSKKNSQK